MAALSPAGDAIVCSGPAAGYRLQRIGLADDTAVVLTPDHPESFGPQFTPDGKADRASCVARGHLPDRADGTTSAADQWRPHVEFRLSPRIGMAPGTALTCRPTASTSPTSRPKRRPERPCDGDRRTQHGLRTEPPRAAAFAGARTAGRSPSFPSRGSTRSCSWSRRTGANPDN